MVRTPFEILDLDETATTNEIKERWRRLCHEHHPDRGGDAAKFDEIMTAYKQLRITTNNQQRCENCRGTGRVQQHAGFFSTTVLCPQCGGVKHGSKKDI